MQDTARAKLDRACMSACNGQLSRTSRAAKAEQLQWKVATIMVGETTATTT